MSPKTMIAMLLIVLGIVAFAYEGINYKSQGESLDVGSLHITAEKSHHIPLPPVAGALALAAGVILLVVDVKKFAPTGARS
jgi:hypothetical protein